MRAPDLNEAYNKESVSKHSFADPDYRRLCDLTKTTYPDGDIALPGYLDWEYNQNPDGRALISVAEQDKKIISQYIVLPRTFLINKQKISGSLSVNTLTHPSFRGRGLFPQLVRETFSLCRTKEILFTIGFPNSQSHPVIRKKKLFETPGYLPLLIAPLNPLGSLFRYISGRRKNTGDEIEFVFSRDKMIGSDVVSEFDFEKDASLYNDFLESFHAGKSNVTLRELSFLRWRYQNNPRRNYRLFKVVSDGKIQALAIFRCRYIFGIRCGILVDFMTYSNAMRPDSLLRILKRSCIENKIDLIVSTASINSAEYSVMKKAGFISLPERIIPQRLAFIVQKHSEKCPDDVSDFKKWFLTFGDYDIF